MQHEQGASMGQNGLERLAGTTHELADLLASHASLMSNGAAGFWASLGEDVEISSARMTIDAFAEFVRGNPGAPAEALYRFASGQNVHAGDPAGFATLDPAWRVAYETFARTLCLLDRIVDETQLALMEQKRAERAANAGPAIAPGALQAPDKLFDRKSGTIGKPSVFGKAAAKQPVQRARFFEPQDLVPLLIKKVAPETQETPAVQPQVKPSKKAK